MSLALFDLSGRVAIVTGAGRGIGKALALGLAAAGADVVVAARTASDIEETAAEIRSMGRKSLPIPTDVRLSDQVANLVQQTVNEFGKLDIMVNNAGGAFVAKVMEMSEGAWDALIRENLKSAFLCSKEAGKVMVQQKKGSIINMASVAGMFAYRTNASYGAAKAGIIALTKTLAADLGVHHIRVNAIAPGYIETAGLALVYREHPEMREKTLASVPLGRLGKPEDIVGVTIFLASDASDYVTGQTFVVDGGFTIAFD
jgi:NAD(P)-dependent dehydrogenase (short-subunit alcohol dehydrogenase family)